MTKQLPDESRSLGFMFAIPDAATPQRYVDLVLLAMSVCPVPKLQGWRGVRRPQATITSSVSLMAAEVGSAHLSFIARTCPMSCQDSVCLGDDRATTRLVLGRTPFMCSTSWYERPNDAMPESMAALWRYYGCIMAWCSIMAALE